MSQTCQKRESSADQIYRTTPFAASRRVALENSPSKVAAADQPFIHFISTEAVVSAESLACAAPLTTKDAPGSVWKVAAMLRSGLKSCAQAKRPRKVRIAFCMAQDLSVRTPSSERVSVTLLEP